jgi:hypothetical protein
LLFFAGVLPLEVKNKCQASLSGGSSVQPTCGHTIHQLRGIYKQEQGKWCKLRGGGGVMILKTLGMDIKKKNGI